MSAIRVVEVVVEVGPEEFITLRETAPHIGEAWKRAEEILERGYIIEVGQTMTITHHISCPGPDGQDINEKEGCAYDTFIPARRIHEVHVFEGE